MSNGRCVCKHHSSNIRFQLDVVSLFWSWCHFLPKQPPAGHITTQDSPSKRNTAQQKKGVNVVNTFHGIHHHCIKLHQVASCIDDQVELCHGLVMVPMVPERRSLAECLSQIFGCSADVVLSFGCPLKKTKVSVLLRSTFGPEVVSATSFLWTTLRPNSSSFWDRCTCVRQVLHECCTVSELEISGKWKQSHMQQVSFFSHHLHKDFFFVPVDSIGSLQMYYAQGGTRVLRGPKVLCEASADSVAEALRPYLQRLQQERVSRPGLGGVFAVRNDLLLVVRPGVPSSSCY